MSGGGTGTKGTDIHFTARSGDLKAVQSILASNPLALNSRDKHSRTPLILAAWAGKTEVVSYLCTEKADVGAAAMDDMGAIHFAAQKGHLEVVRILVSAGASVKSSTRKGMTPLHYAVQGLHRDLIKYLVKKGASLSAKTKAGKTPYDLAENDEINAFLKECEQSFQKEKETAKEQAQESKSDVKPLSEMDNEKEKSGGEAVATAAEDDKQEDESEPMKRKAEEDDTREATAEPKKAKVALQHLLTEDDTAEDEETS